MAMSIQDTKVYGTKWKKEVIAMNSCSRNTTSLYGQPNDALQEPRRQKQFKLKYKEGTHKCQNGN